MGFVKKNSPFTMNKKNVRPTYPSTTMSAIAILQQTKKKLSVIASTLNPSALLISLYPGTKGM